MTYQRDMETASNVSYPRDAVLSTVEYDSPGCHDAQNMCTGSHWAPLMRVNFAAAHSVTHTSGSSCAANGNLRCDDPVDLSGSGGLPAPLIQSTFVLNDAQVQVRASGSAGWNTLRDYQFGYDQGVAPAPNPITDPVTGSQESIAGRLLLTRLQVIGADGATALPARTFHYSPVTEYYEDSLGVPLPSGNCGPPWNNGNTPNGHTGCVLWSQSYAGNSYYLDTVSNGLGLAESFTWLLARNNFHGVVSGSPADPNACNNSSLEPTFPCNMPDDGSWSRVVLTQRQDATNGVTSTWSYSYQVPYPLLGQECSTCVAGFYWGSQTDAALLDFYDGKFFGFAVTNVSKPDGSLDVHKFHSTEGWGLYDISQVPCNTGMPSNPPCHNDPWSDLPNAAHEHEYELDQYDTNGATLLKQVKTQWQAVCPPAGVAGSPPNGDGNWLGGLVAELDFDNPEMVCELHRAQVDEYTYDGTGGQPVHSATQYTYDGLGRIAGQTRLADATATDSSGHGLHGNLFGGATEQAPGLVSGDSDTAMRFDGSTGTIRLNLAGIDTAAGHQVTVEFWMSWSGSGSYLMPFGFNMYDLSLSTPLGFGFNTGNGDVYGVPTSAVPVNTPVYVVAVFTNGGVNSNKLYFNGVQQTLTQLTGTPLTPSVTTTANISSWPTNPNYYFNGTLDEVAVYNGALSASRVSAHYTAGSGYRSAVLADSPLSYYRLDDGSSGPGPNTIVKKPQYVQDDGVTATSSSATGRYLIDYPAFDDVEDPSGNRYQCSYTSYDGQAFATGQSSQLTLGEKTTADRYTGCGSSPSTSTGLLRTTSAFDVFGNLIASTDPDANGGVTGHTGCTVGSTAYSACTTYDSSFDVLPTSSANALNQVSGTGYGMVADSSGNAISGRRIGSPTLGAPGLVSGDPDTAMAFDGATNYVEVPYSVATNPANFTVEAWANVTGGAGTYRTVVMSRQGSFTGTVRGYNIYAGNDDHWWFYLGTGVAGANWTEIQGPAVTLGQPTHLVGTWSNGTASFYVNGSLAASTSTAFAPNPSKPLRIGAGNTDSTPQLYLPGTIDEVAVYPSALSATRIQAHFTAGAGYNAAVTSDFPRAYYRLDDGQTASSGFGLWPVEQSDANGQTTTTTYDALGRVTGESLPGERAVVADSSGHGNTGEAMGQVGFGASGLVNGDPDTAASFGPGKGTVALNLPSVDTTSGHQVTVEFWMKWNGSNASGMPFGFWNYDLYLIPGTGFGFNTGNGDLYGVASSTIAANTPVHVVAVFTNGSDGANQLYINGVGQTLTQLLGTPQPQPATRNASIDSWASSNHYTFNGTLDEVAIYNGALPASRVQAHFSAGANYKSAVLADSPIGYYRLDETSTLATSSTAYTIWCSGTAAQTPCVEIDKTQRMNSTTTATSRSFYDGLGHLVETRSPAPGGQDVVRYAFYDASHRLAFRSVPYFVTAYTGPPGSSAYSTPDSSQAGTSYTYDVLGRQTVVKNALSFQTTTSYAVTCAPAGTGDPGCFERTLAVDPNGHQGGTLVDGLGRTAYVQRYTGNSSSTYALYATAKYTYDFVGELVKIVQPDGTTQTTFGYDMAGRKTSMNDPDLGQQSYSYDQDGNLLQSVDARGSTGTIFMGYDGLNRPIWRNTSNSPMGAYDTYTYDSSENGNVGVGRLTSETFATGSLSGSYAYTYDGRGQQTNSILTVGGTAYSVGSSYDDAGNVLAQMYPDGETVTNSYTAQGWLSGVTTSQGATTLASNLAYGAGGGAFGEITGASIGNGTYTYTATYDAVDRATDLKTTKTSGGTVMFDQQRTFDPAGNVATINTTMPNATDNQSFCHDDQDRLTWSSSATATPPCGGSNTAGTLTAAQYTQTFGYDVLGRLTSGPLGTYTYASSAHVHAATGIGTAWTAAYDTAGNMTCRAPSSSSTCSGTQTGAQLGYNNEGELQSWQNAPSSPSTTAQFLYDGQGQRVEQSVTQSGTTTTTVYVGDVEEVSATGGTTTTTAYYYMSGKRIGLSANGTISYLASDGLGSATVTLSSSGSATAAQLFAPYGAVRYSSGAMPTTYGFTGQRSDAASGLDYYGARYYDPLAGQFTSADSIVPGGGFDLWGLSRYAYVGGNPIVRTDATGHDGFDPGAGGCSDPSCGGGPVDTPPADPCGGACYYDYNGTNSGTSYTPPPPDPVPNPVSGPTCACAGSPAGAHPAAPVGQSAPDVAAAVGAVASVWFGLHRTTEEGLGMFGQALQGGYEWVYGPGRGGRSTWRLASTAAEGFGYSEAADNLGAIGLFVDINVALLLEEHQYESVKGPGKWGGIALSTATDVVVPIVLGLAVGWGGARLGAPAGADIGKSAGPEAALAGAAAGGGAGQLLGVGLGGIIGGFAAAAINSHIIYPLFGVKE